jgi:hypothetical protein
VAISLYADFVVAAGAVWCAGCAVAAVKGFANACYKSKEGIAKGVACPEDGEVTSPVRVELRRS